MILHKKKLLLLMFTILLLCCVSSHAQPQTQIQTRKQTQNRLLLKDTNEKGDAQQKTDRAVIRSRSVKVDLSLLANADGSTITVPLFDGKIIKIDLKKSRTQLPPQRQGDFILKGKIQGDPAGSAIFAVVGNTVTGKIVTGNLKPYQLRYIGNGVHSLGEIDPGKFQNEGEPLKPKLPSAVRGEFPTAADTCSTDPQDSIDLMVVYTPAARAGAGGTDSMTGMIYLTVEESNQSYINSDVNQRLRLVHIAEVNYIESKNEFTDLDSLQISGDGSIDNVQTLRDTFAADIVSMIVEETTATNCGLGYQMTHVSNAFEGYAYNIVPRDCAVTQYSLTHEVGHNMGGGHVLSSDSPVGDYPYDHGFVHPSAVSAESWVTMMAHILPGTTRVPYWSSPDTNYPVGDVPMGTAATEDNHRVLNNTAATVANFRCSSPGTGNVWMKDTWNDTGAEPNPNTAGEVMWQSPYIWVRNSQDTAQVHQHEHQNPVSGAGLHNYIYVKLHNGSSSAHTGQLDLRYARAAAGLIWPGSWTAVSGTPVSVTIAANSTKIVEIPWPDVPGAVSGDNHYCMVAMWFDAADPMDSPLVPNIYDDTLKNNNVVWRNMNVVEVPGMGGDQAAYADFIVRNVSRERASLKLEITAPEREDGNSFFDFGRIEVEFDDTLAGLVEQGYKPQPGARRLCKRFIITDRRGTALFQNITVPGGFEGKARIIFRFEKQAPKRMYQVVASQYQSLPGSGGNDALAGGVSYEIYNYKR